MNIADSEARSSKIERGLLLSLLAFFAFFACAGLDQVAHAAVEPPFGDSRVRTAQADREPGQAAARVPQLQQQSDDVLPSCELSAIEPDSEHDANLDARPASSVGHVAPLLAFVRNIGRAGFAAWTPQPLRLPAGARGPPVCRSSEPGMPDVQAQQAARRRPLLAS